MTSALDKAFPPSSTNPDLNGHTSFEGAVAFVRSVATEGGLLLHAMSLSERPLPQLEFILAHADVIGSGLSDTYSQNDSPVEQLRETAITSFKSYMDLITQNFFVGETSHLGLTPTPTLLELYVAWPLSWLYYAAGERGRDIIDEPQFPLAFAWFENFKQVMDVAEAQVLPQVSSGYHAALMAMSAPFVEPEGDVDLVALSQHQPILDRFAKGDAVKMHSVYWGVTEKDKGKLVSVDERQIVIEVEGMFGSILVHAPTKTFRLEKYDDTIERVGLREFLLDVN
ncbi:uncharacterized protein GGS22DRAFT_171619 [Annulohypoxylon maeteangense]|uniref:uncharacterized protein n=1 Tax=Annulohypoxylon maeteangense TaxID=1927788 RepID=UPI002007B02E|nr:uncharacterized protein GGS22DRAFT_171619 [Annulohypoxylon maeteangense]KAI0881690.1 hypothetical protein GGS22DRAFT_171619 [Annulohypoxylon maeteangense]